MSLRLKVSQYLCVRVCVCVCGCVCVCLDLVLPARQSQSRPAAADVSELPATLALTKVGRLSLCCSLHEGCSQHLRQHQRNVVQQLPTLRSMHDSPCAPLLSPVRSNFPSPCSLFLHFSLFPFMSLFPPLYHSLILDEAHNDLFDYCSKWKIDGLIVVSCNLNHLFASCRMWKRADPAVFKSDDDNILVLLKSRARK